MLKLQSFFLMTFLALSSLAAADVTDKHLVGTKYSAIYFAKEQIGRPYLFGGREPSRGFDCSGLIQYAYENAGVELPRTTGSQYQFAERTESPEPGDLVFFVIGGKRISHAGIYIGDNKMIHAPSSGKRVEIARFDTPYWQKHFYGFGKI